MVEAQKAYTFARELRQKLESLASVEPEGLADLFQYSTYEGPLPQALLYTLQTFLLKRTVAHARQHTQYYAATESYKQFIEVDDGEPPDLRCWPIVNRQLVTERFDEFIADDVNLRSVCHTSGTTGTPLNVYKSFEEIQFLNAYYRRLLRPFIHSLQSRPLILSFPNVNHGVPVPLPSVGMVFASGVTDDTLIQDALKVLSTTYAIPGHAERISILSGLGHHVLFFTSYLLEQGIDPKRFRLDGVNITGGYQAPHWRKFLREAWGTTINDRFTLTEAIGGGSRCHQCDTFHMDPHILSEVIDLDTGEPVAEGVGKLVLTNLHPFVQMQPFIRYDTGDMVYVSKNDCCFSKSFDFLGKAQNCISWPSNSRREWLLFSSKLNDLLVALPDIRIYDWFSNVRVAKDRTVGSLPIFSLDSTEEKGHCNISIAVELKYAPHCYTDRISELKSYLTSGLEVVPHTTLKQHLESGKVKLNIDFLGPNGLNVPIVIKI